MASNFILFNPLTDRFTYLEREFLMWVMMDSIYEGYKGRYRASFETSIIEAPEELKFTSLQNKPPIKALVTARSKPQFDFVKKRLSEYGIEMEYIHLTDEEYLNNDLSKIDADVVIMQENYNRNQPLHLIDLLTHCKFKDWYLKMDDFFTFKYIEGEDCDVTKISKTLLIDLKKEHRIGYLYDLYRIVTLPTGFKSAHNEEDSIIDYSKIIKDN